MAQRIIWNGTTDEALALLHALSAHCACRVESGRTIAACEAHLMLAYDQRAVDGLLFMRRMAQRLLTEEFNVQAPARSESNAIRTQSPLLACLSQMTRGSASTSTGNSGPLGNG